MAGESQEEKHGLGADNFPELQQYSGEFAEVPADIFSRFIPRVLRAVEQEGSRYTLNGAKLDISGERIRMVYTLENQGLAQPLKDCSQKHLLSQSICPQLTSSH